MSHDCFVCVDVISNFSLFVFLGFTQLITMDLRHKEIQGFYSFPVDNLRASPYLIQYIRDSVSVFSVMHV